MGTYHSHFYFTINQSILQSNSFYDHFETNVGSLFTDVWADNAFRIKTDVRLYPLTFRDVSKKDIESDMKPMIFIVFTILSCKFIRAFVYLLINRFNDL